MKTLNYKYINDLNNLTSFVIENKIVDCENILLQVFSGVCDVNYIATLIKDIKNILPHIHIIGATTAGEISSGKVYDESIILSFSLFDNTKIKTYFVENSENSYDSVTNLIEQFDKTIKPKVAISFVDGLHTNGSEYLRAFKEYDKDLLVAGGLAGDNAKFTQTIVFTQDKVLSNGSVVALLYNDDLSVSTKANFGWTSVGRTMTITKAEGNIVYEIDNIPTVDVYKKYLGEEVADELPMSGVEFPLLLLNKNLLVARAAVGIGKNGSLVFAGGLKVGDKVSFGYGNTELILESGKKTCNEIIQSPVESIFIYSCMARKIFMGETIKKEIEPLNEIAPVSGFFTYGEFFSSSDHLEHELLNETMTILTISESNSIEHKDFKYQPLKNKRINRTLKALANLSSQSLLELEDINKTLEVKSQIDIVALEESESRLRLAMNGANDGLWDWNIETNEVYYSPRWFTILGYEPNELPHSFDVWKRLVNPDDVEGVMHLISEYLEKNDKPFKAEYQMKHKEGHWVNILARAKFATNLDGSLMEPKRLVGTHVDITESEKMKTDLLSANKISQNQLNLIKTIIDSVPIRIFWKDKDGIFLGANQLFLDDAGLSKAVDIIGKSDFDMAWKKDAERFRKDDASVMKSGVAILNYEEEQPREDGTVINLMTSKVPLVDINNNIIGILGIYDDITQSKKMQVQLMKQSRLAQMGEMISMIAHQWRQPLSAISSTSIDIKMKSELEHFDLSQKEGVLKYEAYVNGGLTKIAGFVQNLTVTVDDFRNFFKPNKEKVSMKLEGVVSKALAIIKTSLINSNIEIIEEYRCKEKIELHDSEMMQVILNILKNSQDHLIEKQIKKAYIKITTGDRTISICDNGGGIPEDIIGKIFDPYFSTKHEKNGAGLGLYMSKTIIEEHHNGKLTVKNTDDGVCFKIELEIASEDK